MNVEVYALYKQKYFTRSERNPYRCNDSSAPLEMFGTSFMVVLSNALPCDALTRGKPVAAVIQYDNSDGTKQSLEPREADMVHRFPRQFDVSFYTCINNVANDRPFRVLLHHKTSGTFLFESPLCVKMDLSTTSPLMLVTNVMKPVSQRTIRRFPTSKEAYLACYESVVKARRETYHHRTESSIDRFDRAQLLDITTAKRIVSHDLLHPRRCLDMDTLSDVSAQDIFQYCSLFYSDYSLRFKRFS